MGTKNVLQQQCIELGIPFQTTTEEFKLKTTDRLAQDLWKDLDAKGVHTGGNYIASPLVRGAMPYQKSRPARIEQTA
jgi:hypothetical protein